jgi:Rho-binding antiterminator
MMTDYTPIDCALYSEYELAILQQWRLRLSWCDDDGETRIDVCTPLDLVTRDHAEFLVVSRADGQHLELRLDRIIRADNH